MKDFAPPACGTDEEGTWICCDSGSKWHHLCCVGLATLSSPFGRALNVVLLILST